MANDFLSRMRRRASQVEEATTSQVVDVVVGMGDELVLTTPKDTWRATNGWQASIGGPVRSETGSLSRDPGTIIGRIKSEAAKVKPGDTAYLSNPVPYIGRLNDGSSQQAPAGFVEAAVQRANRAGGRVKVFKG